MDLLRANLHARKTEDHYNARLFWGKQLVINNCVKSVPTARFLIHLTLTPSNNETREQEPFFTQKYAMIRWI